MANDHLKRKRILLVDDEPELLDMVVSILQEEGYLQIKTAKNTAEALAACREWNPEFGIFDVMLPDGDGFSLFQKVREFSDFPILFLTARGEDEDKLIVNGKNIKTVLIAVNSFSFIIYLLSACPKRIQAANRHTTVQPTATGMNGISSKAKVPILDASSCILDAAMRNG